MAIFAAAARRVRGSYGTAVSEDYIERLSTSSLLPTWVLAAWRTLVATYAFAVIFTFIGYNTTHGNAQAAQRSFSFFTVLTYWGLAFYFAFAAAHTWGRTLRGRAFLAAWPASLRWLHSAYFATITVFPYIVTVVFWAALAQDAFDSQFSAWSNMSQHALNSLLAFSELLLPRAAPHPWINVLPLVVVLALYLALAYLTHATQGFYVYPFLDPANGSGLVAGVLIGILAATIVVFVIVRYLQWLKNWLLEKRLGLTGPSATHRGGNGAVEKA